MTPPLRVSLREKFNQTDKIFSAGWASAIFLKIFYIKKGFQKQAIFIHLSSGVPLFFQV